MLISQEEVIRRLQEPMTGCLHIGAHECEEMSFYERLGMSPEDIVWIDAIPSKVAEAKSRDIPNVYHATVSDIDDQDITFHVSNNGQSSSMLEFGTHATEHPWVHYVDHITQKTITLDTFFERNHLDPSKYTFWNMDIQGAELLALKGASQSIRYAKAIYLEVNEKELYQKCGLIEEVDALLCKHHFKRVSTHMTVHGWGDALYVKSDQV